MNKSKKTLRLNFNDQTTLFRILFGTAAIFLIWMTYYTFYRYGSIPTDENWFSNTPSRFYITKSFPAYHITQDAEAQSNPSLLPDSIRVGSLIIAINNEYLIKSSDINSVYDAIPEKQMFTMTVFQSAEKKTKTSYLIRKSALPDSFVRVLPVAAHVFDVIQGGASDRAGMRVGDFIVKINKKKFANIWDADKIMRSARAGKTIEYEVIRDNKNITLHVTLARFGFDTSILTQFICGLLIMGFAVFLGLKRPDLKASRLLGLAILMFGFAISNDIKFLILQKDLFSNVVYFSYLGAIAYGIAWWLQSSYYFPKVWQEIVNKKWLQKLPYLFATLYFLLGIIFLISGHQIAQLISIQIYLFLALTYNLIVHLLYRKKRPLELRKISRAIGLTIYLGFFLFLMANILLEYYSLAKLSNYTVLYFLLIPLAYTYTIVHYNLLGINFKIRKNIQYSIINTAWTLSLIIIFIIIFTKLLPVNLDIPRFRLTFTSFELLDGPIPASEQEILEKTLLVFLAVALGFFLWKIRKWGQKYLNKKYFRSQFDYQKFSRELAEVMATKLEMVDLAKSIVKKLSEQMNLKNSGILFFRDKELCCYQTVKGESGIKAMETSLNFDKKFYDFLYEFRTDSRFSVDYMPEEIKSYLIQKGFRHIFPIWFKEKLNGIVFIGEKMSETPFNTDDLSFFTTVAKQASISIENSFLYEEVAEKERMKHELNIARRIQLASLPQVTPQIDGIDLSGISIPASEVGGDYFDYLNGTPDKLTVIVGDVSGKGTSAALYLFKIQGILRSLYGFNLTPRDLFIRANTLLYKDMEKHSFVTAIGGSFSISKRKLVLARAGHLPLFYYHAINKTVEKITPKGLGLGLDAKKIFTSEIEEKTISYNKGDVFLFITDGLTEAKSTAGIEFGEDNISNILEKIHSDSAEAIRDNILSRVKTFSTNTIQRDDQTVVVVKVV